MTKVRGFKVVFFPYAYGVRIRVIHNRTKQSAGECSVNETGYLSCVMIYPEYRGRGLSKMMLEAACNNLYFNATELHCAPAYGGIGMDATERLYRAFGFVREMGNEGVNYAARMFRLGFWKPVF